MGRQSSEGGKRGLKSSTFKQVTANRGGMHQLPQTRRVAGAFGKDGRKTPARAPAAGKVPQAGRRRRAA